MSTDPIHFLASPSGRPAPVANLGLAREERQSEAFHDEIGELQRRLATERSAGRALLAAVIELESRLATERSTSQALLSAVRDLDAGLEAERSELRSQREANGRLWSQVTALNGELVLASRAWWRKLGRRA